MEVVNDAHQIQYFQQKLNNAFAQQDFSTSEVNVEHVTPDLDTMAMIVFVAGAILETETNANNAMPHVTLVQDLKQINV